MIDQTLTLSDGRKVGFSDYGKAGGAPVIWCHGGPGSRLEGAAAGAAAQALGLRVIGIDRPGYGLSTVRPGRSIADVMTTMRPYSTRVRGANGAADEGADASSLRRTHTSPAASASRCLRTPTL